MAEAKIYRPAPIPSCRLAEARCPRRAWPLIASKVIERLENRQSRRYYMIAIPTGSNTDTVYSEAARKMSILDADAVAKFRKDG